ncbi:hypothetical protein [Pigmentiphaga litoralis]
MAATTFLGKVLGERLDNKEALHRWLETLGDRPAVQRGMKIPG